MDLLSADKLPRSVAMSNYNIPIDYLELETEVANLRIGEPFLRKIVSISAYDETVIIYGRVYNSNNEKAWLLLFI